MTGQNALWNCKNPYQGKFTKVLTVCSAGLLRSPTIAWYLTNHGDYNCRACGIHDYALIELNDVLIEWADIIICSDKEKLDFVMTKYDTTKKQIYNFEIPDQYPYRDPELIKIIEQQCINQGLLS